MEYMTHVFIRRQLKEGFTIQKRNIFRHYAEMTGRDDKDEFRSLGRNDHGLAAALSRRGPAFVSIFRQADGTQVAVRIAI